MKAVSIALFAGIVGSAFAQPVPAAEAAKFKEKVLHSFSGTDGQYPEAGLIDVKGTLYGTTYGGGGTGCGYGCGTVFSVNPKTGAETVIHSFCIQQNCTDGTNPVAGLIDVKGTLYGTTKIGGTFYAGTVFSINPNTGAETVVYSFHGDVDGGAPFAGLIDVKGTLYGTTADDGGGRGCSGEGCGTVFSVNPNTGAEKPLYSFEGNTDGRYPTASLINVNGFLYGTTENGGNTDCVYSNYGCGTVFSLDPSTGAETVVYSFCSQQNCSDGDFPLAGLIDVKGTLYSTTEGGGAYTYYGTVFSVDPNTGAETVVHSFGPDPDGEHPSASLIDVNGALYGTTQLGGGTGCGGGGCGTVFSVNPKTGAETVLYSFCHEATGYCTDGANPAAGLIDVRGTLFGTTAGGGTYGDGTVFELTKP